LAVPRNGESVRVVVASFRSRLPDIPGARERLEFNIDCSNARGGD